MLSGVQEAGGLLGRVLTGRQNSVDKEGFPRCAQGCLVRCGSSAVVLVILQEDQQWPTSLQDKVRCKGVPGDRMFLSLALSGMEPKNE